MLQAPTVPELEKALGQSIRSRDLLGQNWRNRVYRIELMSGEAVLAKQGVMATNSMLEYQRHQLDSLADLKIAGLRVPKALGLMKEKRVLLMEFARGETIETLMWNRKRALALEEASALAGTILGQLELAQTESLKPIPVADLAHDLAGAPWSLTSFQQRLLTKAIDFVAGAKVRLGEVYYDYKAANLIFEQGTLTLIDPPDVFRHGILLWDFACFRSSMRRHLWRLGLHRPGRTRGGLIRQCIRVFEGAYLASVGQPHLDPLKFSVVLQLLELQRTALLMTMQLGKIELARKRKPIAEAKRLGSSLGNRLTLPLLEVEKHWLLRQLRWLRF